MGGGVGSRTPDPDESVLVLGEGSGGGTTPFPGITPPMISKGVGVFLSNSLGDSEGNRNE